MLFGTNNILRKQVLLCLPVYDQGQQAANVTSKMSKALHCCSCSDLFGEGTALISLSQYCVNREKTQQIDAW